MSDVKVMTDDDVVGILNAALGEAIKRVADRHDLVSDLLEEMPTFTKKEDDDNFICVFHRSHRDCEINTQITVDFLIEYMEATLEIETNVGRFECTHRIDETDEDGLMADLVVLLSVDAAALLTMFTEWR